MVDVGVTGAELIPPDRERNSHSGFHSIAYLGFKKAFASFIPNADRIAIVDSATRGVRGISATSGGAASLAPGFPPYGLWKSTDGGANFTLLNYQDVCLNPTLAGNAGIIQASFGSTRGVHETALDPGSSSIVYAAPYPQNNAIPLNTTIRGTR